MSSAAASGPVARVAFAGTPEFAARAVAAIGEAGFPIVGVLTQPDRPAGRGLALQASPVKELALARGWPLAQPRSLRLDGRWPEDASMAAQTLAQWSPEVLVVAAYGLILPRWVLDVPPLGCLNIHASLLPRWRGAAPIHRAVEAGDAETGITIMQMDEGLDTGDMLLHEAVSIGPNETTGQLHDRLAGLGADLIVQALRAVGQGQLGRQAQPTEGVSYAHKVDKAEAAVDWSREAAVLQRQVQALNPAPGAFTLHAGQLLKVWLAHALSVEEVAGSAGSRESPGSPLAAPGTVLAVTAAGIDVACGVGVLRITQCQSAGGRRQSAGALAALARDWVGRRLG